MRTKSVKNKLKKEIISLLKSMNFVSNNFLKQQKINKRNFQIYFNIYQQLGIAWEFLGLQCKHWEGYKKVRGQKEACKVCGRLKGVDEFYYLIPRDGSKEIGRMLKPNSKKIFNNKQQAQILNDAIGFHGALLSVDVHNSYKSNSWEDKPKINMAAERIVTLKERGIKCHIDQYLVNIELNKGRKKVGKKRYGGFPWEIKKKNLSNFPVIFDFDENYQLLGLSILR